MSSPQTDLATVSSVIDALGGNAEVQAMCRVTRQAVTNWSARGYFPAHLFLLMTDALAATGQHADPDLWRQQAPADHTERAPPAAVG